MEVLDEGLLFFTALVNESAIGWDKASKVLR